MTHGTFETNDIDLTCYLLASTGRTPSVFQNAATCLATFQFREDSELKAQILAYTSGAAVTNVRRLLSARRRLFHEVRRLQGGADGTPG